MSVQLFSARLVTEFARQAWLGAYRALKSLEQLDGSGNGQLAVATEIEQSLYRAYGQAQELLDAVESAETPPWEEAAA